MRILVTGVSGYVGAALIGRLEQARHSVRGVTRQPERLKVAVKDLVVANIAEDEGLDQALENIDVAYYLVHSMETAVGTQFAQVEQRSAENFVRACERAGVKRIVYLGALVPTGVPSPHIASRQAVETVFVSSAVETVALRASIVIGAHSRSFRLLVSLIERLPVIGLASWHSKSTQPIDERDLLNYLVTAATISSAVCRQPWDLVGPDTVTYSELVDLIRDRLLIARPIIKFNQQFQTLTSVLAAQLASEDSTLTRALIESLNYDLVSHTPTKASKAFGVRLHTLSSAVEHALRVLEEEEVIRAR